MTMLLGPKSSKIVFCFLHDSHCTPAGHWVVQTVAGYFTQNQFLGDVLSSKSERISENVMCTSIVARVCWLSQRSQLTDSVSWLPAGFTFSQ